MLISASEWQAIRQRAGLPQFHPAVQRLRQEVADFGARPVAVQNAPGGYYHDYFCPEHGVQLVFDPASPTTHRCPVDNALLHGEPFDAAWRWFANNRLAEAAIRLALCWRLEGNPEHFDHVAKILHDYADQYHHYQQVKRTTPNPGVATYTTLDESVWVLPLVWAFDLIRERLSPQAIDHISRQLLAPVAEHLVAHHFRGIHNFTCWHNAAIGAIGVVIDRPDLVEFAVQGEFGFDTQLRKGVLADGLWFEGSFSYHFYALAALLVLVKATRHVPGLDLRDRPALRAMLLAPIQAAYPDWSLPATNDCWYFTSLLADCCHGVPPAPAFYEIGYAWYDEPLFAQVLQRAYRQAPRDSLDALLFGQASLPPIPAESLPSIHLAGSGYAVLRSPAPDADDQQRYLLLKYGPHGAGHGHPDKLNLILYANGQRLSADLGTPGYGLDLFESWYRQTVSHNTVAIAGLSQPPASGQIHAFRGDGPFQIADASVTWPDDDTVGSAANPYRGVTMRRVILARPDYFLDLVLIEAQQPRRIDWIYHNIGRAMTTLPLQPAVITSEEGEGYQHITQTQRAIVQDDFGVNWQTGQGGLQLFVAGGRPGEMIVGRTPGHPPTALRTVLIHQRHAAATAYLALFHPYQTAPQITAVEWIGRDLLEAGWAGCVVHYHGHRERWLICLRSDTVEPSLPGALEVDEQFEYRIRNDYGNIKLP